MDDPFGYLRKENQRRKAIEEEEERQRVKEEKQRTEESESRKRVAGAKYTEMVVTLLDQLRKEEYPNLSISPSSYRWSICHYERDGTEFNSPSILAPDVQVTLEFDSTDKPIAFLCVRVAGYRHSRFRDREQIRAGLSREELIRALVQLHPIASDVTIKKKGKSNWWEFWK
jgi:hypothetical protein